MSDDTLVQYRPSDDPKGPSRALMEDLAPMLWLNDDPHVAGIFDVGWSDPDGGSSGVCFLTPEAVAALGEFRP